MTTKQIAYRLVQLVREGENLQAIDELYADDVTSKEPKGPSYELISGIKQVREHVEAFHASVLEFHTIIASDPIIQGDHFAFTLEIDATYKNLGRNKMGELCVYQVRDGKVISDEFFYNI